jgi:hypothetical protein
MAIGSFTGAGMSIGQKAETASHYNDKCNAVPPVARRTAFHVAAEAQEQVDGLVNRICALADKLVGFPSSPEKDPAPQAPGIFGALEVTAQLIRSRTSLAHAAIDKIESELP